MRRLTCILAVLILLFTISSSCFALEEDGLIHNYILIVDNSLSTTGTHSLGSATDPKGMRFDAARLVYENVLSSAKAGNRGKICVIVFCGPENCASYGPMDIGEDAEALNHAIGMYLSESFDHVRDEYTDIRTALETARSMLDGFEGDTSVILLTDGINDLTNDSDPFHQPINIEANDQTIATIEQIRELGADFYVVALTAQNSVPNTAAFMEFINRMALAGGGVSTEDGSYSNVLMATQTDLNSKLLQILIKAESADDAGIQTSTHENDGKSTFLVPYEGISHETVNITFMPEEKEKIQRITLEAPDKTARTIYENGALQSVEGINVTDDRSYIIIDIPSPEPGEWKLTVDSAGKAEINSVIRFNQNLRIITELPKSAVAGESFPVFAWVQQFDGEQYVDLNDPSFYDLSTATMIAHAPGDQGKTESLTLKKIGDRFGAKILLEIPGVWTLDFQVSNDYWSDTFESTVFEVLPSPAGSSFADGDVVSATVTTESEGKEFQWQLEADPASGMMTVSWENGGAEEITAELREAGSGTPVMQGIHSGDAIDLSELGIEQEYALIATAYSSGDEESALPPALQQLTIEIIPDVDKLGGALMDVIGSVVVLAPMAVSGGDAIEQGMQLAKVLDESVEDLAQAAAEAGISVNLSGSGSGSSLGSPGSASGAGNSASGGKGASASDSSSGSSEGSAAAGTGKVSGLGGLVGKLADNWVFCLGAVAILAALIAIIFIGRGRTGERVTGRLSVVCEPIMLDMLLLFDGRGRINVDSPLTKHPDVAKLKGGKIYEVLSHVQVSMSKANSFGMVDGSEDQYMPYESLITLSHIDPRTGEQQIVRTGRLAAAASVLHVYDAGRVFDVYFNSNLDS